MTETKPTSSVLTTTRTDDGNQTTWAVADTGRATTLTIARGTPDQITRMIEAAPSCAGFTDATTATVLGHVSDHKRVGHYLDDFEACLHLGRCDRDTYVSTVAHPLFQAAATAGFDDAAVYGLLAALHAKGGV